MSQRIPPVMTVEERRFAALRATKTARRGADRPRIFGAAFGLCAGLVLSACVPDVKSGTQDSGVVALYNPSSSPAVVPAPNDLVRVGGKLQIPTDPSEAKVPALKAFNDYLRTLDGYPPDSTASTSFAADIDPATLADNVAIYDVTDQRLLTSAETLASLVNGEASRLEVKAPTRWKVGHSYVIAVLSWLDQGVARGVKSADGKRLLADQAFTFLRSERPLIGRCADGSNADCACPSLTDATCKAIVDGISDTQARQLELGRLTMAPGLSALLTAKGRTRADVAVAWSFTVSKRPFAVFDSGRAQIPFPSDLLLDNPIADPGKAKVNLPIAADEKEPFKSLKMGLNTLDGFSTTGSATFPVDSTSDIDAASVSKLTTVFVNLNNPADAPSYTPAPLTAILNPQTQTTGFAGQIWLTPDKPLNPDQNRYAAIVTTAIKDKTGQPLTPAPATFLLTQGNPLVVDGKSAISSISLSNATQLEFLRSKAVQPLLDALAKNPQAPKPSQIAALTIFRTQSVAAPLLALSAAPTGLQVPTDVTFDTVIRDPASLPGVGALIHGTMKVAQLVSDLGPLTSPLNPKVKTIPFLMTLPKKAAVPTARVAIVQHGFTRWRGDAVALAPALAAGGMALFAIDINYHGGRVVCVSDSDCDSGVSCNRAAADPAGTCAGGASKPATGAEAATIPGGTAKFPVSSLPQRDFTNFANLFAARDNLRQHVVDLSQVVRVLQAQGASSVQGLLAADGNLAAINAASIGYVGQSLGAILGTSFLAIHPAVPVGVINVGGAPVFDIFADPNSAFNPALKGFFDQLQIPIGTAAYYSTVENIRWILDPGDPINVARNVRLSPLTSPLTQAANPAKRVIVQQAGSDTVIPARHTVRLASTLGLPLDADQHVLGISGEGGNSPTNVSTYFPGADHGFLFNFTKPALTTAGQAQAVTYIASGLNGTPTVIPPSAP